METENKRKQFYCLNVKTGSEMNFVNKMQPLLDSSGDCDNGKLYCLGKQMRLKNGKEYIDTIFPSYIFWETSKLDGLSILQKGDGFVKILPQNNNPQCLSNPDETLIRSFLKYGSVMPVIHVDFDLNDKIKILDGPFKGQEGLVTAVNRRNKRVNFEVELLNGSRVVGLTYEVVKKA